MSITTNNAVKRFTAKTSREALRLVREALGDDAVVLSTRPSAGGVEVMAMAPESLHRLEQQAAPVAPAPAAAAPREPELQATSAAQDAERLSMSTLSFQDYVRQRMLKRREQALKGEQGASTTAAVASRPADPGPSTFGLDDDAGIRLSASAAAELGLRADPASAPASTAARSPVPAAKASPARPTAVASLPAGAGAPVASPFDLESESNVAPYGDVAAYPTIDSQRENALLAELRAVKGLIEERFGALAFMEKLQRRPAEARLAQTLLGAGFSPMLVRKVADAFDAGMAVANGDETTWAAQVLEKNLKTADAGDAIEDRGGVFALIGATGVGKTTTTAKIAAAFAARHGAASLGLITLDAYRVGAHEQLRAYGRILGVPVHTAHDRASLDDLLELLAGKKMVLIDTAGMAQRDARTRELLDMLSHRSIQRLLVVNAASQGETIEDVLVAYRASSCVGLVLSKIDEAVKLGPALDAAIRHRLPVMGVANGQRVPEDWHRLSASALVQRALRGGGSNAWRLDTAEMNLLFANGPAEPAAVGAAA